LGVLHANIYLCFANKHLKSLWGQLVFSSDDSVIFVASLSNGTPSELRDPPNVLSNSFEHILIREVILKVVPLLLRCYYTARVTKISGNKPGEKVVFNNLLRIDYATEKKHRLQLISLLNEPSFDVNSK